MADGFSSTGTTVKSRGGDDGAASNVVLGTTRLHGLSLRFCGTNQTRSATNARKEQAKNRSHLDDFDGEFKLSVGFQIVQHAIEDCRIDVAVARIAGRVAGRVPDDVVTRIADGLL